MRKADPELVKQLSKFSKEAIIEALVHQFNSDYIIRDIVNNLEYTATRMMLAEHEKALNTLISAREAYFKWRNKMCLKYGDGKTVILSAIPPQEITRGAVLERALMEAYEAEQKLDKKVCKMLKQEEYNG